MGLDPNIFFQGAQLQMQSRAQMAQQLENSLNRVQQQRQFEAQQKNKGFDLGAAAEKAAFEYELTGKVSPEGLAAIKGWDALNAGKVTYTANPDGSGTLIPMPRPNLQETLFGGKIPQTNGAGYQPAYPAMGDMMPTAPGPAPVIGEAIPPMDMAQLNMPMPQMGSNPPQGLTPQQQQALEARGNPFAGEAPPLPTISAPSGASPKTRQQAQEAGIAVQQKAAEADIEAAQAGAKKASELQQENRVNVELRNKGLQDLTANIDRLIQAAEGTPSGVLEGAAATATELLGAPSEKAIKRAEFTSGKAISGLQSRIAFLKGQGTITDAEAKQAMGFIPEANEPYQIKIAKLKAAKEYMSGLVGNIEKTPPSTPGFRYLGTE